MSRGHRFYIKIARSASSIQLYSYMASSCDLSKDGEFLLLKVAEGGYSGNRIVKSRQTGLCQVSTHGVGYQNARPSQSGETSVNRGSYITAMCSYSIIFSDNI